MTTSAPYSTEPRRDDADNLETLWKGLQTQIRPVERSFAYRAATLAVAVLMVLLPLVYVSLIVVVGLGILFHTFFFWELMDAPGSSDDPPKLVMLYVTPLIIGPIFLIFMVKPLLSPPAKHLPPLRWKRDANPVLFEFADRIADVVRAPRAATIRVDLLVNASASLGHDINNIFRNDLVLTIGLPLVAELNTREFAGVLAHEFGHFSQGAGMRLSFLIQSINIWFARVVYQRDAWDEGLTRWSNRLPGQLSLPLYATRFFIWITRGLLWALMQLGRFISSHLSWQMEFDADRYQARLVGSDVFEPIHQKLAFLSVAENWARQDLEHSYAEKRLPDDWPAVISHRLMQLTAEMKEQILNESAKEQSHWFSTHPPYSTRLSNVDREKAEGTFHVERPASFLFRDFPRTCREVTLKYYQELFGETLDPSMVQPTVAVLRRREEFSIDFEALARYTLRQYSIQVGYRGLELDQTSDAPDALRDLVRKGRASQVEDRETWTKLLERLHQRKSEIREIGIAEHMIKNTSVPINKLPFQYQIPTTPRSRGARIEQCHEEISSIQKQLTSIQELREKRFAAALARSKQQVADWDDESLPKNDVERLLQANAQLTEFVDRWRKLTQNNLNLKFCLHSVSGDSVSGDLAQAIIDTAELVHGAATRIHDDLGQIPYPFDPAESGITVGQFISSVRPEPGHQGQVAKYADELFERTSNLQARIVGRLCRYAEAAEQSLGFETFQRELDAIMEIESKADQDAASSDQQKS